MNERHQRETRQSSFGEPRDEDLWGHILTACKLVLYHVNVDAVAVSIPSRVWRTVVATDQWAEQLEDHQTTLGEGPSSDVIQTGLGVLAPDLHARRNRWPVFAEAATVNALAAAFSLPILRAEAIPIGALTLYRRTSGPLTTAELRHTAVMASFITKLVDRGDDPPATDTVHDRHSTVSAATDLLSARHAITRENAQVLLRAHAFAHDRPLLLVAEAVIDEGLWSDSLEDNG
jgi:hypothetical protein